MTNNHLMTMIVIFGLLNLDISLEWSISLDQKKHERSFLTNFLFFFHCNWTFLTFYDFCVFHFILLTQKTLVFNIETSISLISDFRQEKLNIFINFHFFPTK